MGLFSGDSSSTSTSNAFDQRKVLDGGSIDSGGGNVQILDGNAINAIAGVSNRIGEIQLANNTQAFQTVSDVNAGAGSLLQKAVTGVLNFGSDIFSEALSGTLGSNQKTVASSLNFASDIANGAGDLVSGSVKSSLDFANDIANGAGDLVRGTVASSFNFGNDALSGALSSNQKTLTQAYDFGSNSLAGALDFGRATNTTAANLQSDAISFANNVFSTALKANANNTDQVLDSLKGSAQLVKDSYADAKGRGALTDYLMFAALAVAGIVAYRAVK